MTDRKATRIFCAGKGKLPGKMKLREFKKMNTGFLLIIMFYGNGLAFKFFCNRRIPLLLLLNE